MTDRDIMQQALEALETNRCNWKEKEKALSLLRAALAQPEQEPKLSCGVDYADGLLTVSVMRGHGDGNMEVIHCEQIAIARPEQEPVAWPCHIIEADFSERTITLGMESGDYKVSAGTHYLSTAQPQRTWVGLTDEEKAEIWSNNETAMVVTAAEAKLKEKNT